ncbi:hypothetical protein Bca52824_036157 [Brassica carinata]|uniref:Uncharacterized protein n=1 Tax=Brassica carinata TaxID=52824 RepID=A0A8X7V1B8_BRACI|nr:hypothetical protein Bca52824_036157 [Brassica carinata]
MSMFNLQKQVEANLTSISRFRRLLLDSTMAAMNLAVLVWLNGGDWSMVNQEWFEEEEGFSLRLRGCDDKKKLLLPIQSITSEKNITFTGIYTTAPSVSRLPMFEKEAAEMYKRSFKYVWVLGITIDITLRKFEPTNSKLTNMKTERILQKLILQDPSLQQLLEEQASAKASLNGAVKLLLEELKRVSLLLTSLTDQLETALLKTQAEICHTFTRESQIPTMKNYKYSASAKLQPQPQPIAHIMGIEGRIGPSGQAGRTVAGPDWNPPFIMFSVSLMSDWDNW